MTGIKDSDTAGSRAAADFAGPQLAGQRNSWIRAYMQAYIPYIYPPIPQTVED